MPASIPNEIPQHAVLKSRGRRASHGRQRLDELMVRRQQLRPAVAQVGFAEARAVVEDVGFGGGRELKGQVGDFAEDGAEVRVVGEGEDGAVVEACEGGEGAEGWVWIWTCGAFGGGGCCWGKGQVAHDTVFDRVDERWRAALEELVCAVGFQEGAFV